MTDSIVGWALIAAAVFVIAAAALAALKHPARQDGPEPLPERGSKPVPYHCATFGHYYRKAFADRWQCAQCGHLVSVEFAAGLAALANGGIDRETPEGEAS